VIKVEIGKFLAISPMVHFTAYHRAHGCSGLSEPAKLCAVTVTFPFLVDPEQWAYPRIFEVPQFKVVSDMFHVQSQVFSQIWPPCGLHLLEGAHSTLQVDGELGV
jgi:hypothetical protein